MPTRKKKKLILLGPIQGKFSLWKKVHTERVFNILILIDSIFRNRIQIDERLIKRLSKRAVTLLSAFDSLEQEQKYIFDVFRYFIEIRNAQLDLLHTELLQFEFSLKKVEKMILVAQREMDHYKSEQIRLGRLLDVLVFNHLVV